MSIRIAFYNKCISVLTYTTCSCRYERWISQYVCILPCRIRMRNQFISNHKYGHMIRKHLHTFSSYIRSYTNVHTPNFLSEHDWSEIGLKLPCVKIVTLTCTLNKLLSFGIVYINVNFFNPWNKTLKLWKDCMKTKVIIFEIRELTLLSYLWHNTCALINFQSFA